MLPTDRIKQEATVEDSRWGDPEGDSAPGRVDGGSGASGNDGDDRKQSQLTDDDLFDIMRQQTQVLKLLMERSSSGRTSATQRTDNPTSNMVNPAHYCGGVRELDWFLDDLRSNFRSHAHIFPRGGPDHVMYALQFLGKWGSHSDPAQRQTKMTDPVRWGISLFSGNHQCLHDFSLFEKEILRMYGDNESELHAAQRAIQECMQCEDETVSAYALRIRAKWSEAGWIGSGVVAADSRILYDLAWVGLREDIKERAKIFVTGNNGRFKSIDEMFDIAADVEPLTGWENQGSAEQLNETQKGNNKRNYMPSTSKPTMQTGKSGGSPSSGLPPAPWVSAEVFERRKSSGKCGRCGSGDHKSHQCPRYARAHHPQQQSLTPAGNQVKRQRTNANRR
jgi:hypothetical protein